MIYVIAHKQGIKFNLPGGYVPLYVGNLYQYNNLDNINHLNLYINELTGLYHIWKHVNDDIVGMCHYRRVFLYNNKPLDWDTAIYFATHNDIIVTESYGGPGNTILNSLEGHFPDNLDTFYKYMDILFNRDYRMQDYFTNECYFNPKNMFVARKEIIDNYCDWLFPLIIPITEKFVKEEVTNSELSYFNRMIGFIGERLLTGYLNQHEELNIM